MRGKTFRIPIGTEFKAVDGKTYKCVFDFGTKGVALDPQDGSPVIVVPHDAFFREVSYSLCPDFLGKNDN